MNQVTKVTPALNQGQDAAAKAFFEFLFSDQVEFNISGKGGVGKTFLMSYMIDTIMPQYHETCELMDIKPEYTDVVMTATTNKAAEVLAEATRRPTQTIQSFLRLKVSNDYESGSSKLSKRTDFTVHENLIIFIDECSMIDSQLYSFIHQGTSNCKIVYVGDHCQLAPVMEVISPVYRQKDMPFVELTEPVRNADQPALRALCDQLRHSVETKEFFPIQTVPGVIDHVDDNRMQQEINTHFSQQTRTSRILAYTNARVVEFNDYIRSIRSLPNRPVEGENLVNNAAIKIGREMLSVEQGVSIYQVSEHTEFDILPDLNEEVQVEYYRATLQTHLGGLIRDIKIPANYDHVQRLKKYYGRQKNWNCYFYLKETFPDLRPRDACTVHKSQGSTYDTVFVDLGNISTCHNPAQVSRMLYVAFSRARSRIVLYGNLAQKYGGVIN